MVDPVAAARRGARGRDSAMDDKGRESGHLMLITPERVFYAGLVGRPRARCQGAFNVYVALQGGLWLTTVGGGENYGEFLVLPPNIQHPIASDHRSAIAVLIEPESLRPGALDDLARRLTGPEQSAFISKIRSAYEILRNRRSGEDITSAMFDTMCFGEALPRRQLDPRVVRAIAQIGKFSGEPITAASCASQAGLSSSRFLHLFKEETDIAF